MYAMSDLLQLMVSEEASDLHVLVGVPPVIHVLRARRCRTSPPTFPLTNDRRKPPPGMNRNHTLINL
jgi:Tfp pilus assembly ATPase PilU